MERAAIAGIGAEVAGGCSGTRPRSNCRRKLSIVRTMAESHGWTVDLDETADGARFVVSTGGVGA